MCVGDLHVEQMTGNTTKNTCAQLCPFVYNIIILLQNRSLHLPWMDFLVDATSSILVACTCKPNSLALIRHSISLFGWLVRFVAGL